MSDGRSDAYRASRPHQCERCQAFCDGSLILITGGPDFGVEHYFCSEKCRSEWAEWHDGLRRD